MDLTAALEYVDGDEELLRDVLDAFRQESRELVVEIQSAIAESDAPRVQRLAHTIKGSARLFPASPVRRIAERLEGMGRESALSEAEPVRLALADALTKLLSQLDEYLE